MTLSVDSGPRTMDAKSSKRCPIKVCYVIDHLGLGGAQQQLVEFVRALPKDRYSPVVISLRKEDSVYSRAIKEANVELIQIPQSGSISLGTLWRLYRCIKRISPTIVHTGLFTADLYGRLAAKMAKVSIIISTTHNVDLDKPLRYVIADRWLRKFTHAFLATSHAVESMLLQRERVKRSKTTIIYNGVDIEHFSSCPSNGKLRADLGISTEKKIAAVVGRLALVKDHETFLKAANMVSRDVSESVFLIVGSGPLANPIRKLSGELGLSKSVYFMDMQEDVLPVYDAMDVLVVSSYYEGCCRVILEAMAMGKPVIATAVGGNPELVVHGQTGLLVPVQDVESLAQAMIEIFKDPAKRESMARQAREVVRRSFTLEKMVSETEAVYERLLASLSA